MYDADRNLTPDQAVELVERLRMDHATTTQILFAVEADTGVSVSEMFDNRISRNYRVAYGRAVACGCMRDIGGGRRSFPDIAREALRRQFHSGAWSAYQRWLALPDREQILDRVRARIRGGK